MTQRKCEVFHWSSIEGGKDKHFVTVWCHDKHNNAIRLVMNYAEAKELSGFIKGVCNGEKRRRDEARSAKKCDA
jgi:hypothetical protein